MDRLILSGILFAVAVAGFQQDVFGAEGRANRGIRIESISTSRGKKILTIRGTSYEVSPISQMSDAWVQGQKVELSKNEQDLYYSVTISNIDNGESVVAKKLNGQIPSF